MTVLELLQAALGKQIELELLCFSPICNIERMPNELPANCEVGVLNLLAPIQCHIISVAFV